MIYPMFSCIVESLILDFHFGKILAHHAIPSGRFKVPCFLSLNGISLAILGRKHTFMVGYNWGSNDDYTGAE